MASTTFWPCETRTSTCRSFATISSDLYRFLAITVLLDVKDIPQVGPLQWGWISHAGEDRAAPSTSIGARRRKQDAAHQHYEGCGLKHAVLGSVPLCCSGVPVQRHA